MLFEPLTLSKLGFTNKLPTQVSGVAVGVFVIVGVLTGVLVRVGV